MEKRYTLSVAIALVVGTVIGSGVFFKAEAVLTKTGGNLSVGILAFIIMGVVMIISACTFGVVAQSHQDVEGLVGYARASCGKTYGYYVGWFMAVIYYPSLVAVLSWLPARYFGVLMGWEDAVIGGRTMMLAGVFMIVTYTMNALAPRLAGRFAGRGGVLPKHWRQSGMNCRSRVGRRMSGTSRLSPDHRPCGGKRLRMPCGSADRDIPQKRSVPARVRSFFLRSCGGRTISSPARQPPRRPP